MLLERPKFMENKEWYYDDEENEILKEHDTRCLRLTDKAPLEAVESYLQFYETGMPYWVGFVPEFIYEEYNKAIERLNNATNKK